MKMFVKSLEKKADHLHSGIDFVVLCKRRKIYATNIGQVCQFNAHGESRRLRRNLISSSAANAFQLSFFELPKKPVVCLGMGMDTKECR